MAEAPGYAIIGRGPWAARMQQVLAGEGRRVISISAARQLASESGANYRSRLAESLRASGARVAWLCVSPGAHVPRMMEAALDTGLDVVAEKPWLCSRAEGESLVALARARGRLVAMHYEYCFLEGVEKWRREFDGGEGLRFGGHFVSRRPGHAGISALDRLGCHLLAMRRYAVPRAAVSEIRCAYEMPDERNAWVESRNARVSSIDFLGSAEPIIQRFIGGFEAARETGKFPLDLEFALGVAEDVRAAE
jgi:predicted dehydrogenase